MGRLDKLLSHALSELAGTPRTTIPELARKFGVPEGHILESLRGRGVEKARSDLRERVLVEVRAWGRVRVRVRNDWASLEVALDAARLLGDEKRLRAESEDICLSVQLTSVTAIYFVEDPPHKTPTIVFCNKRGRPVFEIAGAGAPEYLHCFHRTRDIICVRSRPGDDIPATSRL